MSRVTVRTIDKEVEKPQGGGGKGTDALYGAEVLLDGNLAFVLHRHNFAITGQFVDFVAWLQARGRPKATEPLPHGMTREKAVAALRDLRRRQLEQEAAATAARDAERGRKPKEAAKGQAASAFPVDALLDYIEACGFPAPEKETL